MRSQIHRRRGAISTIRALTLAALIPLMLAGCGLSAPPPAQAHQAQQRAPATATESHPRVAVLVLARQQSGSVAKHNAVLEIDAYVINYTSRPNRLAGNCVDPFILLYDTAADDPTHTISLNGTPNCVLENLGSYPREGIAPETAYHWASWELRLFDYTQSWQARHDYVLTVTARAWFQGTIAHPMLTGSAQGSVSFTLT